MIKEIKTEKFEGLAVLVPDDASGFTLKKTTKGKPDQLHYFVPYTLDVVSNQRLVILPAEGYKILGIDHRLTEEQCAEIMPKPVAVIDSEGTQIGTNYLTESAKGDFNQFMVYVLGAYSINPLGNYPDDESMKYKRYSEGKNWHDHMVQEWHEAQANTGVWIILNKL